MITDWNFGGFFVIFEGPKLKTQNLELFYLSILNVANKQFVRGYSGKYAPHAQQHAAEDSA